jgi:DNA invertase Pin-like site-specific DNA recombinase
MIIGYARVSTTDQTTDLQVQQLEELGCTRIFKENASGKNSQREQLKLMIDFARDGDVIHVMKVDRLARNTIDALTIADRLKAKNVGLVFQDLSGVDINSEVGRLIYTTISAFAQMERERILKRANEGRAKAKADGKHLGRHANVVLHSKIKQMFADGVSKSRIAKENGCSRPTVYAVLNGS